ncbi:hypothetical protein GALMADRAFT_274460 [Galerina marginata CBS 339.88]|uniref:Diphthamide biosynthesis protein 4 n=1 Tax=Galerina marginata (strain CBS 339.88) TaxID=685588 RepID=A0A067TQS9_GALM3|nr:hypothetical protein GALMADRAFT_274460 [Galerina marginata CBS 339.88]
MCALPPHDALNMGVRDSTIIGGSLTLFVLLVISQTVEATDNREVDPISSLDGIFRLLGVHKDASPTDIKAAYHRVLLQAHPDKRAANNLAIRVDLDIALIKEAYTVLSDTERRAAHDVELRRRSHAAGPRPAQVVSLEEFEDESTSDAVEEGPWRYGCRCGGWYRISTASMELGEHLIACSSCSEAVWVGYELVES